MRARYALGIVVAIVSSGAWSAAAEDGMKALPTLLIKGEVVSLDTSDSAATLLKVKDRYGFETPIFITPETKVSQGDQTLTSSSLQSGAAVEVEYSFDINTAKRYAVVVKLPAAAAAAPAQATSTPPESPTVAAPVIPGGSTEGVVTTPPQQEAQPSTTPPVESDSVPATQ